MSGRVRVPVLWIAAAVFAVTGVLRLTVDADLRAFAHLSMALALALVAIREGAGVSRQRFWYLPEVLLLLAVLQYAYHFLGV